MQCKPDSTLERFIECLTLLRFHKQGKATHWALITATGLASVLATSSVTAGHGKPNRVWLHGEQGESEMEEALVEEPACE
jgi:hypothetical protein